MRHVAIALLSAHFPNKNQRVVCEDSAKRKMISVSPLANGGDETLLHSSRRFDVGPRKNYPNVSLRFRRSKKLVRKSFKGRFESYSNDCLLFFVFSFKRGRSSKLAVGPRSRRTKIVSISGHTRREQRKNWYSFAESMAEFRCTVVTDPERRSKTNTANNNFSQISRGIVRPLEIASKTSKAFT